MHSSTNSDEDGFENIGLTIERIDKKEDHLFEQILPEANPIYKFAIGSSEQVTHKFQKINMK
jgi:hypothetical protein